MLKRSVPSHSGAISRSSYICVQTGDEMPLSEPLNLDVWMGEQRLFTYLQFKPSQETVGDASIYKLRLMQVDFGVDDRIETTQEFGHIIQEMDIKIQPAKGLAEQCTRVAAEPVSSPKKFLIQETKTFSTQFAATKSGGVTCACLRGTAVQSEEYDSSWSMEKQLKSKSVIWTYTLHRSCDGAVFPKGKPGSSKFVLGWKLHTLSQSPKAITHLSDRSKTEFEAEWKVPFSKERELKQVEWDITVTWSTMHFSKVGFLGRFGSKISFGHPLTLVRRGIYEQRLRDKIFSFVAKKFEKYLDRKY